MPNTKAYLALKVTRPNGDSLFMLNVHLKQNYRVGETFTCQNPHLPFFICPKEAINENGHEIRTGAWRLNERNFVVLVYAKHLSKRLPWDCELCTTNKPNIHSAAERVLLINSGYTFGARKLKILAEIPAGSGILPFLKAMAKDKHLPILTESVKEHID